MSPAPAQSAANPPCLSKSAVETGLYLIARSTEEDSRGNSNCALELFFAGVDSLLFALPLDSIDGDKKLEMQTRLMQYVERLAKSRGGTNVSYQVAPFFPPAALSGQVSPQSSFSAPSVYTPPPPPPSLTDTIVNAAVAGAVALKQSPIPDAISSTLSVGLNTVKSIDNQYGLKDRILNLGKASISKAVEIDNEYKLHQKLGTAMLTGLTALTQATMAYKNAPSYTNAKGLEPLNDYHSQQYGNSHYFAQQPSQVSYFTDLGGSAATTSYSQQLLSALPASQILEAARLLYK